MASQRAWLLFQHGQYEEALKAARQMLAENPEDVEMLAVTALSLSETDQHKEAEQTAQELVSVAPDIGLAHSVLAAVRAQRGKIKDALVSIREAIRLDPENPNYYAFEANLYARDPNWKKVLECSEHALALDPEHVDSLNLRSMALANLGRVEEAHAEIDDVLRRAPEDSLGHTNRGWAYLQARQVPEALEHFTEALRLDPENGYARSGLVEALKARNLLYRGILTWYLFANRFSGRGRLFLVIGVLVAFRIARRVLGAYSTLAVYLLVGVYMAFMYLSWVGQPLFNLMLLLDPKTQHLLSKEERTSGSALGATYVLAAILSVFVAMRAGTFPALVTLALAIVFGIPVSGAFATPKGWPRTVAFLIAGAIGLGVVSSALLIAFGPEEMRPLGARIQIGSFLAAVLNTWVVTFLRRVETSR